MSPDRTGHYDAALGSFISGGNGDFTMLAGEDVEFVQTLGAHAATVGALPTATDGRISAP